MREEWRPIKGFEAYEVSNYGNVRSIDRFVIIHGLPSRRWGHAIRQHVHSGDGCVRVNLSRRNKGYTLHVSKLVATAFVPNPKGCKVVRHIDGNRRNNLWTNLKWIKGRNRKGVRR